MIYFYSSFNKTLYDRYLLFIFQNKTTYIIEKETKKEN